MGFNARYQSIGIQYSMSVILSALSARTKEEMFLLVEELCFCPKFYIVFFFFLFHSTELVKQ